MLASLAVRNIRRKGWNSILLILALGFVAASVSSTVMISDSLLWSVESQGRITLGSVDILIGPGEGQAGRWYTGAEINGLIADIRSTQGVSAAETILVGSSPALSGGGSAFIPTTKFVGAYREVVQEFGAFKTLDGRTIGDELAGDQILVNEKFVASMPMQVGEYLFLLAQDHVIALQVIGVATSDGFGGFQADSPMIFLSMNAASIIEGKVGAVNRIVVKTAAEGDMAVASGATDRVSAILANYQSLGLAVLDDAASQAAVNENTYAMPLGAVASIGMFSTLTGFVLIAGFMGMSIQGRSEELSVLRSLGLRRGGIRNLLVLEALILSTIGVVLGVLTGMVLTVVLLSPLWSSAGTPFMVSPVYSATTLLRFALIVVACALAAAVLSDRSDWRDGALERSEKDLPKWTVPAMARRPLGIFHLFAAALGSSLGAVAFLSGLMGSGAAGASLAIVAIGSHPRFRHSLLMWLIISAFMILTWVLWFDNLGIVAELGASYSILLAAVFLLSSLALLASSILRNGAGQLLRMRKAPWPAIRLVSIKHLTSEDGRRAILVMMFAALFLLVSLSTLLVGMAVQNIDRIYDESSGDFGAIAVNEQLAPITLDVWEHINTTAGPLTPGNVTLVSPVYAAIGDVMRANASEVQNLSGENSYIIGVGEQAISVLNFPLLDYDRDAFVDGDGVWKEVARNASLAIIDANLAASYSDIIGGETVRIDVGTQLTIVHEGQNVTVTVVGITEQRFIGGVFVKESIVRDIFNTSAPSVLLIKFKQGLDPQRQSALLQQELFGHGILIVDLQSERKSVDAFINEWHKVFNAFLGVFTIALLISLVMNAVRSVKERQQEISILKTLGLRGSVQARGMLIELTLPAIAGLTVGAATSLILSYLTWKVLLQGSGFDLLLDYGALAMIDAVMFIIIILIIFIVGKQVILKTTTVAR
jgi:ABC-type antimicrobial peptide transport system permease subunit